MNDQAVDSVEQLLARLDEYRVGDIVRLTLELDGKRREVEVALQPGT